MKVISKINLLLTVFLLYSYVLLAQYNYTSEDKIKYVKSRDSIYHLIINQLKTNQIFIYDRQRTFEYIEDKQLDKVCVEERNKNGFIPWYKTLKTDSLFLDSTNIYFYNKRKLVNQFNFKTPPIFFHNQCNLYFVSPAGWGPVYTGMKWGNIMITGHSVQSLFDDLEKINLKNDQKISFFKYWNNFNELHSNQKNKNTELTESQRKLVVQANALMEQKNYNEALNLYNDLFKSAPFCYPEGYFNMALIAERQKNFVLAIVCMEKYLLINPKSEDARKAQDKIYEWELFINK